MSEPTFTEETTRLRGLVPLQTLPDDAFNELLESARLQTVRKGKMLFEQGDTDHEHVYLLEGTVFLLAERAVVDTIQAGSDTARFPLAHQLPRRHSARAKTQVRIARIDSRLLSDALARTQTVDYQVNDFEEASDDDWMSMLLQSRVLQQVPAANIQRVMMNVEQVEVGEGEDLVIQGDPGDYYYMLTDGRAVVRRDNGDGMGPVELATLGPGDAFGEEALLSDSPRNSTITMLQAGMVLRLSKEHFLDLIDNPLLERIDMQAGKAKVDQGAIWLDLRSSAQYDESHLPRAINFPFESLRYQTSSLAPDRHYVLYSNTGGRAMAGAFLMAERGFDVSVLEGGIRDNRVADAMAPPAADEDTHDGGVQIDDAAAQARIEEAEHRARELEARLQAAEASKEGADAERQEQLLQVGQAVDQARRKLVETEEQKREALAAKQKAYAEMERLTGSLEAVESERASLQDRMAEIEGLDKELQARLAKAERELIGERERAESATSSLEDISEKLTAVLEQREQEREQHARALGELKEEMTALQMELEQAQLDLDELREDHTVCTDDRDATVGEDSARLQQALKDSEADREGLAQASMEQQAQIATLGGERDALQRRLDDLQAQEDGSRAEAEERAAVLDQALNDAQARSADALTALQADLDQARNEMQVWRDRAEQSETAVAKVRDEARVSGQSLQAAQARITELETAVASHDEARLGAEQAVAERDALASDLERLQAEHTELKQASAAGQSGADEALGQLRAQVGELARKLEEREQALAAAHDQQAELIEALNTASSERESLDLALSDTQNEQARLVDLENQVAEAQRTYDRDILAHEQVQQELREQLDAADAQQRQLQVEVDGLKDQLGQGSSTEARLRKERDAVRSELASRETEVEQLRSLVEQHVEKLRELQGGDEQTALRAELETVREQAIRDVAQLREQLSQFETQKRRLQQADGREAISLEAMRQKIDALESSLNERQRELADAQESQQMLEDAMEDANYQLDAAKRELERALVEADEAVSSRREAETARDQLQQALYRTQEDTDESQITDLRDVRLANNAKPIGMDGVFGRGRWLAAVLGAGLAVGALEALSLLSGRGELFSFLLRLGGQ